MYICTYRIHGNAQNGVGGRGVCSAWYACTCAENRDPRGRERDYASASTSARRLARWSARGVMFTPAQSSSQTPRSWQRRTQRVQKRVTRSSGLLSLIAGGEQIEDPARGAKGGRGDKAKSDAESDEEDVSDVATTQKKSTGPGVPVVFLINNNNLLPADLQNRARFPVWLTTKLLLLI